MATRRGAKRAQFSKAKTARVLGELDRRIDYITADIQQRVLTLLRKEIRALAQGPIGPRGPMGPPGPSHDEEAVRRYVDKELHCCTMCFAYVPAVSAAQHTGWHAGVKVNSDDLERRLNMMEKAIGVLSIHRRGGLDRGAEVIVVTSDEPGDDEPFKGGITQAEYEQYTAFVYQPMKDYYYCQECRFVVTAEQLVRQGLFGRITARLSKCPGCHRDIRQIGTTIFQHEPVRST